VTRDPRTSPRPGDVVTKNKNTRTVTKVTDNRVTYVRSGFRLRSCGGACLLTTWQQWCKDATVEKVEDGT